MHLVSALTRVAFSALIVRGSESDVPMSSRYWARGMTLAPVGDGQQGSSGSSMRIVTGVLSMRNVSGSRRANHMAVTIFTTSRAECRKGSCLTQGLEQ